MLNDPATLTRRGALDSEGPISDIDLPPPPDIVRQRYMDPTVGQFLTQDPIEEGTNFYTYVHNRPLDWTDPTGLAPFDPNTFGGSGFDYFRNSPGASFGTLDNWNVNNILNYGSPIDPMVREFGGSAFNDSHISYRTPRPSSSYGAGAFDLVDTSWYLTFGLTFVAGTVINAGEKRDAFNWTMKNPDQAHDAVVNATANFQAQRLLDRGGTRGVWNNTATTVEGLSYALGKGVGYTDALEAGHNIDLQSREYLDPTGGWNENRILRMNAGVEKMAFSGAGLASTNSVLTNVPVSRLPVAVGSKANWTHQGYYPPNNGFAGTPVPKTLQPGELFDRYGFDSGKYVSPVGTLGYMRSLPPGTTNAPYSSFRVAKPLDIQGGTVSPWFRQLGGGAQYRLPHSVQRLLQSGHIERVGG